MIDPWLLLITWINRLSGVVLIGFAVYALSGVNLRDSFRLDVSFSRKTR